MATTDPITRNYHTREVEGTAASGLVDDLYNPRDAIKEGICNSLNWIHKAIQAGYLTTPNPVKIRLHDGPSHNNITIEDSGLGFESFKKVQKSGNKATTKEEADEYKRRRDDPDYTGRFGAGLNGLVALSADNEIEIKTVHIDEQDRTSGFISHIRVVTDALGNRDPQFSDPEIIDSKYIMDHPGCILTVLNAKKALTAKSLDNYLSTIFYRKLAEGYQIRIKDMRSDNNYHPIFTPEDICCDLKHEVEIGTLSNGYPVYAHIHELQNGSVKKQGTNIDLLIKKIGGFGVIPIDRKASGYVWTSGILPQMGRNTVRDDPDSPLGEFCKMIDDHCEARGIPKASEDHASDEAKNPEQIKDTISQIFTKYFSKFPHLVPPEMKALMKPDPLEANTKAANGWDNKAKEDENGNKKKYKKKDPKRKYKKHKRHKRQLILNEGQESKIALGLNKRSLKGFEVCWIDPGKNEFVVNSAYPNSKIYRMIFARNALFNMEHFITYALMAVIRLAHRDTVLSAGDMMIQMGLFWEN